MELEIFRKNLNIRPDKKNKGMIEDLEYLAQMDGRTLNNYVVRVLSNHISRNKKKVK